MDDLITKLYRAACTLRTKSKSESLKLVTAKIEALWVDDPVELAYYKLADINFCGVRERKSVKIDGNLVSTYVSVDHLMALRRQYPKVTKEEVIAAIKERIDNNHYLTEA